jgi:replicative DNA helicase
MDKTLPRADQAEEAVIGSVLIDSDTVDMCLSVLTSNSFYKPEHAKIWKAIEELHKKGMAIDTLTVNDEVGEGYATIIADIIQRTPHSGNVESYVKMVDEAATKRMIISTAAKVAEIGYQGMNADEALNAVESAVMRIRAARSLNTFDNMSDLVSSTLNAKRSGGIMTGIKPLDDMTSGWQNSDLVIIAARPSVGKTALAVNFATAAAAKGKQVAIFSLEMSGEQITARMLSDIGKVDLKKIRDGGLSLEDGERLNRAADTVRKMDIWIDDSASLTPLDIRARCRRLRKERGLDLVIVDYLQLLQSNRQSHDANRVMETSEISRNLKAVAREFDVPVIALSQLSRQSEYRDGGEPRLSDLRDSGSIEQDADIVLMLWRTKQAEEEAYFDTVNFKVAKHRNGPIGDFSLIFRRATTSFREDA